MNKLKTGKGALKDYQRYLADEYDDYAEEPEETDPISHIPNLNKYQMGDVLQKPKPLAIKHTSRWPKYKSDFNLEVYSQGILDGVCGEKIAKFLKISDLARLLSTSRYLSRAFIKASIWISQIVKIHKALYISDKILSRINVRQFFNYLQRTKQNGVVFDTVSLERDMKGEDKNLARNSVDFVTMRSQKTIKMVNTVNQNQKGVLTGDMKISLVKETNEVCVWVAGFEVQQNDIFPFACILFKKKYEEVLIQKAYFLNDGYFVIEIEEKSGEDGSPVKSFEIFSIELEPEWYEKKQTTLCKQVLKETLTEKIESVKIKSIGEFFVFVLEKENQSLWIQVFDTDGKCLHQSKDLAIAASLDDMMIPRLITKSSFSMYLLDQRSDVYLLNYDVESGVTLNKLDQPKVIIKEEEEKEGMQLFNDKEQQQKQRFFDTVKKYHYGKFKKINEDGQSQTIEYLMLYKEKRFYFAKFETNELIQCELAEYDTDSRLYNWTICEDYLYLLTDTTIQIYQLDFNNYSAVLYHKEKIDKSKFGGSAARWILVDPCLTILISVSSFAEPLTNTMQLFIGSTQKLLMSKKLQPYGGWGFDDCNLYDMLEHVEKWQDISELDQETIECRFEDERLLIQTKLRSYFRDFSVCEEKVNRNKHGWKLSARYDLGAKSTEEDSKEEKTEKKSNIPNLLAHENKNHGKMKKSGNQNWKNIEKKAETEEKIEKKESRKKGDKYYKNVRQGALKDYYRCLADEYDDYAEEPEEIDPISHISQIKTENLLQKPKPLAIKHTSRWPKYKSNFNLEVYSRGISKGVFGENIAKYLKILDIVRLMSTCRFFFKVFSKTAIWINQMIKNFGKLSLSEKGLSTINIQQYYKYLHYSKKSGIVFDTVTMERNAKDEDRLLARSLVDFVSIKSQKAVEMTSKLTQKGTLTGDMKISWIKETNQVCVWVSGFYTVNYEVFPFACILFTKKYEEVELIQKAYFLNDKFFVIEMEEGLEVFAIEAEAEWYEKKQAALCKQVLKETFTEKVENIKIKSIGDFLVFILEKEKQALCIQVFDINRDDKFLSKPEDFKIDAGLHDVVASNSGTNNSFSLYLLDKESDVYILEYSVESGTTMRKIKHPEPESEKDNKETKLQDQRFLDTVKKYHYGINQSKTFEYLMIYKEKKFYFLRFDSKELIHCDLPGYDPESKFFNCTICGDYLYILLEASIQIYQLNFNNCSARLHKKQTIENSKFQGNDARWIFVNPCVTVILNLCSLKESINYVQVFIGQTQRLLVSKKFYPFDWVPDECELHNLLENVEEWKEKIECKFEDERLLIQTSLKSYFRDFTVCEKRVNKDQYRWEMSAKYDLAMPEEDSKQAKTEKKNRIPNLSVSENKNHDGKMKKNGNHNWKNTEKKIETEERIEKKENRKKGDKYYKNVRQNKHRGKMSD